MFFVWLAPEKKSRVEKIQLQVISVWPMWLLYDNQQNPEKTQNDWK